MRFNCPNKPDSANFPYPAACPCVTGRWRVRIRNLTPSWPRIAAFVQWMPRLPMAFGLNRLSLTTAKR